MKIEAKVVADSRNQFGNRITTMIITYPRIIHSEFMTHRMFSRNASSSRAVPAEKMIQSVIDTPFIPLAWQKQHKGMQGSEYITNQEEIDLEIADWLDDRDYAVKKAKKRLERGVTKQLINRPLECFQYYTTIVTATEWENFFALRCPKYELGSGIFKSKKDAIKVTTIEHGELVPPSIWGDITWLQRNKGQAEIHMMALAEAMWDAYNESIPNELREGEWHIPFEDNLNDLELTKLQPYPDNIINFNQIRLENKIKISTVMCARTSYTVIGEDQKPLSYERMFEIHDNLLAADPKHMSPFEHCAISGNDPNPSGNFTGGWIQYRKMIPNENIK